ncbi:MAG: RdgB/HAM1 family non-canonical purine NTP pyrophosphatase [Sphingobacteriia bacterium]|nr:MAG: RdgB/HAM1 family non-canonical purine NTP pyrophosphatase [Sphingobacteriia bacterium]TAG30059.1 MAG: RdgB/HAM1 family non-canonical purine NTP pyrophosphatase [Sphingobacteriia bacterium]TAH05969.1 MAG: RdgB/HAM1 family non-canonical purine NTP pyrophosphatase [Sphingobacteriia bacterium]
MLIFATNNSNKVKEIKSLVAEDLIVLSLADAGINIDIPEPFDTLEANATEKSTVIHQLTKQNCFSEDTGLEVSALNGAPGVKSARYAGENRDFQSNIDLLLLNLQNEHDRTAQFRTVISLIWEQQEYLFEGICTGKISQEQKGKEGFGYDPIFIPDGATISFAEMTMEEKNQYSHRKKAMHKLIDFLKLKLP